MEEWDPEKLEAEWNKSPKPALPDWFLPEGSGIFPLLSFLRI